MEMKNKTGQLCTLQDIKRFFSSILISIRKRPAALLQVFLFLKFFYKVQELPPF
jgi:hypothetical protein